MDNKYLFAVVGGVFLFLWYWVGHMSFFFASEGGMSMSYLIVAVLVLTLGGGNSEGSDLIAVATSSLTSYIPKFIALTIAYVVGTALYQALASAAPFDALVIAKMVATLFTSGALVILTVACLKKAT